MTTTPETKGTAPETRESADLLDWGQLGRWALFVLHAPGRHKLLAATCFLAMVGAAVGSLKVLPKRYQVQATVLAQPNPLSLEFNQFDAPTRAAREIVMARDNLVSLLKRTNFAERHAATRAPAARARDWAFRALGRPERTPEQVTDDLADALEDRLWVTVSAAGTIHFGFQWSNRDLAYDIVEVAVQSFLEARHASDVARIGEAIEILEEHASRLNVEITEKTKEVTDLELAARAVRRPAAPVTLRPALADDEELPKLGTQLATKRRALAELEDYRQRQIAELQAQLLQQQTVYAEQHPVVAATRRSLEMLSAPSSRLSVLRGEIAEIEREITRRGGRPGEVARTQRRALPGGIEMPDLAEDPKLEYARHKLWLLVRQHSALLERIDSARVDMDTARAGFKYRYAVITPPQVPKGPIKPNALKVVAMGVIGGMFLAVFASVATDLSSGRAVPSRRIEDRLGVPVLAKLRDRP